MRISRDAAPVEHQSIRVRGTVQGVGFRPFVYREATRLGLLGSVRNDEAGVLIEAIGAPGAIAELCSVLSSRPPPLARVTAVEAEVATGGPIPDRFEIVASTRLGPPTVPVSVDSATCADCLAELADPADRRYRYPFINCTNCGPRYTIVVSVPYDRPATTMAGFVMCEACQAEYDDPADRRFHAQPNACPECGPELRFLSSAGARLTGSATEEVALRGEAALRRAVSVLEDHGVVAVKGLGGYHLAADATDERAVGLLRARKARDDKPFAVMVATLEEARQLGHLDAEIEAVLADLRRPIVLLPRRARSRLASGVAPGLVEIGVMLAYTPLHHLLLEAIGRPLVMTSGNLSDDPIAYTEADGLERLADLVDGFLFHNRPIETRCDDSIIRATALGPQMLRRSRGYVPEPLALPERARRQVLSLGAELKSTVSVARERGLVTSQHIGDLEHLATYQCFVETTRHLRVLYGVEPEVVAHDLHPEYLSTKFAEESLGRESAVELWGIQHHHAHLACCLIEHGRLDPVVGVAFDGLGFGVDGTLWGGEFFVVDLEVATRVGHLATARLPGGAAAVREPWRMALSWAAEALGESDLAEIGSGRDERWQQVLAIVQAGHAPLTTSVGRLFDAVASLLGIRHRVTYEGQAAIELEAAARSIPRSSAPAYEVAVTEEAGSLILDPRPLLARLWEEQSSGVPTAQLAAGFHESLGRATATIAAEVATRHRLATVALSGGVFQNSRLSGIVAEELARRGLAVLTHRTTPPGDGGISIGQAAIAALAERPPCYGE